MLLNQPLALDWAVGSWYGFSVGRERHDEGTAWSLCADQSCSATTLIARLPLGLPPKGLLRAKVCCSGKPQRMEVAVLGGDGRVFSRHGL